MDRIEKLCVEKGMRMTEQRRVIARVISLSHDHPDVEELHRRAAAVDSGISIATVALVEARLARDVSADAPLLSAEDGTLVETFTSSDPVLEPAPTPEDLVSQIQERDYLRKLVKTLTHRERQIVCERVLAPNPPTIARLAEKLGITPQRVHQLETRALKKLKAASTGMIPIGDPAAAGETDA